MKHKFNNILWTILISWIVIFGTVYANANCHDQVYSRCSGTDSRTVGPSVSGCSYDFQCATVLSFSAGNKELCCRGKFCQSEGKPIAGTKNPLLNQKHSVDFVSNFPRPPNKDKALNIIFGRHKTVRTTPIYTLTQSFLC